MAYYLFLISGKSPTARAHHRVIALLLVIFSLTSLWLVEASLNAEYSSIEDAIRLLSSSSKSISLPINKEINYHGVIKPIHSYNNFHKPASEDDDDEDEEENQEQQTSPSSRIIHSHGQPQQPQPQRQKAIIRMNAAIYPIKDQIPDVNSPQVKAWVSEIDWTKVPNIPVAPGLTTDVPHFPKCPTMDQVDNSSCWWSCSGCVAPQDVITCPDGDAWGLTYDDGPSLATREMIQYLGSQQLTATFFIVGSRVLEYGDILKEQVAQGHHLGMHTWSHAGLTTLTNHQIVAEIRWTEKIIRDVTGLTMKYVRPPYGDIDNRVREILRQMGYTTVIWTKGWDTNDWRMLQNQIQEGEIIQSFQGALDSRQLIKSSSTGLTAGPITLEHDLTNQTIALSKRLIPMALSKGLKPMSVAVCLSDATPYQRGSTLGPNGAKERINNGESRANFRGMPGMEEQDFASLPKEATDSAAAGMRVSGQLVVYAILFLATVLP